jgi:hypothetical protein
MAQVYPFSYQQRHPEWHDDPWLHGYKLVKKHFGAPLITFSDALFRNPKAMIEHMRWHVRLVPAGLQLAMFNGHFGPYSPDFTAPRQLPWRAGVLSSLVLLLMAAGVWCIRQRKAFFRRFFRSRRGWAWLGLLCLLPPCAVAILTQRPRPSYIFPLSFFLMAVTGLCLYAVLHRLKLWRSFQKAFPLFVLAVLGSAYSAKSTAQIYVGQPLKEAYDRIFPFREHLQGPRSVLVSRQFNAELNSYINLKNPDKHHYQPLVTSWLSTAIGFQQALDKKKVSLLYLDTADFAHPIAREWLSGEGAKHWTLLAGDLQAERPWAFLERKVELAPKPAEPGPGSPVPPDAH